MILAFQLALVALFLIVARYLDNENKRVNADNVELRSALTLARREAEDAVARCVELTVELDEYRKEEAKRERRREGARLN